MTANPLTARPTTPLGTTVLGYPRIGPHRELKRALESYWAGRTSRDELERSARELRAGTSRRLAELGLASVPSNTFSYYDQVLDAATLVGAVPDRFRDSGDQLDTYFAMARGAAGIAPLEMTKWFDTNYHYLVPEVGPNTGFELSGDKPIAEYREARELGVETRPVVLGPVSFLLLAKPSTDAPDGFSPLDRLDDLLDVYAELLTRLYAEHASWVQLDEPAFVADRSDAELAALAHAYERLGALPRRPAVLVASYFGALGAALPVLAATSVEGIGLDLVAGDVDTGALPKSLRSKTVAAGVVDGRNVWRTDLDGALDQLTALRNVVGDLAVSTSCSLLHVPYDVEAEQTMDPRLRSWLAFAEQKVGEVAVLGRALAEGTDAAATELEQARVVRSQRAAATDLADPAVRNRLAGLSVTEYTRPPYSDRAAAQREWLELPDLPVTTIGSFPQTDDVRRARAGYRAGRIGDEEYVERMRAEIRRVVELQEGIGVDVVVHGEPERNDMVQYFAEQLTGFVTTTNGWVQSYGSRCVRPPILYGDVSRPAPMTVEWSRYAASLTQRPVKGMLTGPVTILAWSFVRDDQPLGDTARQVALAIRDETVDLENAGISIIQVDEPALRELLPLRKADQPAYLDWAVAAFRLATAGVAPTTQVHTHLCYSEFAEVFDAIDALDADVTSIEAARSRMELLPTIAASGFERALGPGVYDIHSPRVPGADEVAELLRAASVSLPADRLWVNPDCGLKTRTYAEVEPAIAALVDAARRVRAEEFTRAGRG